MDRLVKSTQNFLLLWLWLIVALASLEAQEWTSEKPFPTYRGEAKRAQVLRWPLEETIPLATEEESASAPRSSAESRAPALKKTIEGIDFKTNGDNTGGRGFIPPDPSGAAGREHLLLVVNVCIQWYQKSDSARQKNQSLKEFFADLGSEKPVTFTFDPKVIYDQYENRFVVITLEQTDEEDDAPNNKRTSYIFIAVSKTGNPNDGFRLQRIDAKNKFPLPSGGDEVWADYPGLAVDDKAIYITNNMFTFPASTATGKSAYLWLIDKGKTGGLYDTAGGNSTFKVKDPWAEASKADRARTSQPAHLFGTPPSGMGTFLVAYDGLSSGGEEGIDVIRVDDPLGTPKFNLQTLNVGDIDDSGKALPEAPQKGSSKKIATNDRRSLHAVWRANALWSTTTLLPPSGEDAGQATAHWFKVNTSTLSSLSLADQSHVGGEDAHVDGGVYTFFPSIMVDKDGNMGIGFAASSANMFCGAYYTGRGANESALQATATLAEGKAFYERDFGSGTHRWGDYSAISLDPSDETTFWVFNEYAIERGNASSDGDGQWGTRFGSFIFDGSSSSSTTVIRDFGKSGGGGCAVAPPCDPPNFTGFLLPLLALFLYCGFLQRMRRRQISYP